ncbi:hypothetical protein [Pedobacter heparinus]|uniref:VWA domain-containing protein n=1 Tax=Pedobacter heparinus (strain ATCC 13125 / DSM 2366 / CIP 104194 / JCM 7457 / NBRC 12017 / NCIMB 9290 / NRRL B-14731 / HIM 762-3) TaxID=485917 RepID=C6Y1E3_PEDHD|nr:hypothetical protein [Pedobacter heparinus]ACU02919.1 hypothetical protein Phep_0697 [Pedobacter heparinus DSM 2366]
MSDSFTIYSLLTLTGALMIGVLFAWLLYGKTSYLNTKLRYALAAMRVVSLTAIGFLLFFPLIRSISYTPEKPLIIIGQDNSLSIGNIIPAGFNKAKYEQDIQLLARKLGEKYEVKIYNFSDSIKNGFDFSNKGKLSNAARLIAGLNDEYLNRNVGAVIIASDGIFNRGGSPLYEVNKLKAPVYTIALGDTIPKKDLLIANINHNDLVYLNNEFNIEVQVQAFEAKGEESSIAVLENGKKVYEERLSITSDAFVKNIPVRLKASKLGLLKYTVQLRPVQHEVSEKNNEQNLFVEVIDTRMKVLIAAAGAHPDIAALKQAIGLNRNFEVKIALAEELNALNLNDYGLLVLYQLPSLAYDANLFMNKVAAAKAAVWYILGGQSNINAFNQVQKQVNFTGGNNTMQETYSHVNPGFTAFDLDETMRKRIEVFDPLFAPFGKPVVQGNAAIVLNQRIGKISTDYPQLFFMTENGRKMGFLIGEGLWKWKLSEAGESMPETPVFNSLLSKAVQYLSLKDDKRKFKVYTSKNTFDENENVLLNAVLYNDSYIAINAPDVSISIKNDQGKEYKFLFSRTEMAYQLDAGALPPGNYTYVATTAFGAHKYRAQGIFFVNTMVAEYQQTTANHQLLNSISVQTGGKMYMPQQLLGLVDEIKENQEIRTLSYEDRKYEELINFKWLFGFIMALLALECFFRKRNGEI